MYSRSLAEGEYMEGSFEKVVEFLEKNSMNGCLATEDNGVPHVRPWGFMCEHDGKLWFCTSNKKDAYRQMAKNPKVEFSYSSPDYVTVRISGSVVFTGSLEMKQRVLDASPMVKGLYKSADNPVFEVFCLEHGTVIIADFSGNPPQQFTF